MKSRRGGREKKLELSDHLLRLRQRLQVALSLGIRLCDNKVKRWQCVDAEVQLHALRAMTTFIDCISCANMQHFLIKETIADMLVAFGGILLSENEKILSQTMKELLKLLNILGTFMRQFDMVDVIFSLSRLLRFLRSTIIIPSAIALNDILTNLGRMRSKNYIEIWKAVESTNAIGNISLALQDYELTYDYFKIMASLLRNILWKLPSSRYSVWSNNILMVKLGQRLSYPDPSFAFCVLQIYSALALCGNGTVVLLENEELFSKVVWALGSSQDYNLRVQALKIFQHLLRSQEGCSKLSGTYCEAIVQGIVAAMAEWLLPDSKKGSADHMILVKEACKAALMVRWPGNHQLYFWKYDVDGVLLEILTGKTCTSFNQMVFQPEEVVAEICDSSTEIRPYIWDILGWIAVHCPEDFVPKVQGKVGSLDALINIACSMAYKFLHKKQVSFFRHVHEVEPVSRAVLLMVFSPCTYISSLAKTYVSEWLRICDDEYIGRLLNSLMLISCGDVNPLSDGLQTVINLISIACYSTLTQYQHLLVHEKGIEILVAIIERCLNTEMHINRSSVASHLNDVSDVKLCCWNNTEDWEGGDLVIFYCLQALSQLITFSSLTCNQPKVISRNYLLSSTYGGSVAETLLKRLGGILDNAISPGIRWYSGYLFSFFGLYGFPSKLGERMKAALDENELADLQYVLSNGQCLTVHSTILMAGCPYLLPSKEAFMKDNKLHGGSSKDSWQHKASIRHEVKMSEHINSITLAKILEYVYTGFIIVENDLVKPLSSLAKHCGLTCLSQMLSRRLPRWGTSVPHCDFSQLLDSVEHHISHSENIKVPVGWEALHKLVKWFYSGNLPRINLDCNWNNMSTSRQLNELQAYVELFSLAEFWLLEGGLKEESFTVILSCLELNQNLSKEIINFASDLGQWKIVEAAAASIVPLYPKLRDAGDLEKFSEAVVDILRSEYVRHSQKGFDENE
ncbi:BTB/POZ domain-containing protein [Apostasia shenzhenica]|uniref:BTB/POZ domain-containing protein n=1 Tax=Apostasia shenzhenica TaxID=1088818 RepID=A0A2I0B2U4_9ASPA|nr:BTB/POZ domain-containing protein [Apostasia shenzhenica]